MTAVMLHYVCAKRKTRKKIKPVVLSWKMSSLPKIIIYIYLHEVNVEFQLNKDFEN